MNNKLIYLRIRKKTWKEIDATKSIMFYNSEEPIVVSHNQS